MTTMKLSAIPVEFDAMTAMKISTEIREIREAVIMGRKISEMSDADRGGLSMSIAIARSIEACLPMELRRDFLDECGLTGAEVSVS